MKKIMVLVIVLVLCVAFSASAFATSNDVNGVLRENPIEFMFEPPYGTAIEVYNGSSVSNSGITPHFVVNAFLNNEGLGTTDTTYYQNTYVCLLDAYEWEEGNMVFAANPVQSGTTVGATKTFTYNNGYGPGSGNEVTIAAYPVNYNLRISYGINIYWYT